MNQTFESRLVEVTKKSSPGQEQSQPYECRVTASLPDQPGFMELNEPVG